MDERMDLFQFREKYQHLDDGDDYSDDDLVKEIKKLKILRFDLDNKKMNIVSHHDGTIVFIDPHYNGEKVNCGDIWLCSIRSVSTVFNATPLRKITASMLMGMDDGMRKGIEDALWKANRSQFETVFKEKYSQEVYASAYKEATERYNEQLREKDARIADLEKELNQSRYIIQMKPTVDQSEGIQLRSDDPIDETPRKTDAQTVILQDNTPEQAPTFQWTNHCMAPGIPEMRYIDVPGMNKVNYHFVIERVAPETLRCEGFPDGKYFVHISPKKNILVIRKHEFGSALCIDQRIRLDGLGELSPFTEKVRLVAEYNQKYDGILVYL